MSAPDSLTEFEQKVLSNIKERWEKRTIYKPGEYKIGLGYVGEIPLPQLSNEYEYTSNLTALLSVLNNDLSMIDEYLNNQNYTVEVFDGFYQAIILRDSTGHVEWKIQPSQFNTVNSIRKFVYADKANTQTEKSESYWIQFDENHTSMDFFRWQDDHAIIHFYTNNMPKEYGIQIAKYRWDILKWDENGNLEKEWIRDDSKTMNQSIQRLKDRGVLDEDGNLIVR